MGSGGSSFMLDPMYGSGLVTSGFSTAPVLTSYASGYDPTPMFFSERLETTISTEPTSTTTSPSLSIVPNPPVLTLAEDSGSSVSDRITNNGQVNVSSLIEGGTWAYTTDGGAHWRVGTGDSFTLSEGTYDAVQIKQFDAEGNESAVTTMDPVTVDTTPPVPTITLDEITTDNLINSAEAANMIEITGRVGGDAQVGDVITLLINKVKYTGIVTEGDTFNVEIDTTRSGISTTGTTSNDYIDSTNSNTVINTDAGSGNDLIFGGNKADAPVGGAGNDIIHGGDGSDTLSGGAGHNILYGDAGNDTLIVGNDGGNLLYGGTGNDTLTGGTGNDFLIGGQGNDRMTGGGGIDTFVWMQGDNTGGAVTGKARDTITDFKPNPVGSSTDASVLNLSDLLSGEHLSANSLDNYLNISASGGNTTIKVDPTGSGSFASPTQTIILSGVDLTAVFSTTSSHAIVDHLIANGNLITHS